MEEPIASALIDAWIVILPSASQTVLETLEKSGKPLVCIGFPSPVPGGHSVLVENKAGMKAAVRHLIAHGHTRIAFVGKLSQYDLYERYLGYREALAEHGLPMDEGLVVEAEDNLVNAGEKAMQELLDRGVEFTAIAAGTDFNALGAIDCLQARGFRVPQDFAVSGFDDIYQAAVNYPSLTTVRQPIESMANEAVRIAIEMLEGRLQTDAATLVSAGLVVESSCSCSERSQFKTAEEFDHYLINLSQMRRSFHTIANNNYQMTKSLINATRDEKIDISKLFWNTVHWGCLALWESDESGGRRLVVHQSFSKRGDPLPPIGAVYPFEQFPPLEMLPPGTRPGERISWCSIRSNRKRRAGAISP